MSAIYIEVGQSFRSDNGNYYLILEFLGNGANAYAYRCLCTSGQYRGLEFVLKLQYNLSTETRRERFFREASFLEKCSHPAILAQYDKGIFKTSTEQFPFIVTDFMPETLAKNAPYNKIRFETKVKYACQLLSAIMFLQSKNIIHRDIKPNNIFISNTNAVLGDFGLIKNIKDDNDVESEDDINLVNETVMSNNTGEGVMGYAAMAKFYRTPELVNYANHKDKLYLESDIFQLGLVLTELFTGRNPLRQAETIRDPIQLCKIGTVDATCEHHGRIIHDVLAQMIQIDRKNRISATSAMDKFTGVYQELYIPQDIQ